MAEPVTTTTAVGAGSVGLTALLIGWIGPIGADVMMVVMSSIAGCVVALSGVTNHTLFGAIKFISAGVLLSLVTAWMMASLIASIHPTLSGPYLPSAVAFAVGVFLDALPSVRNKLVKFAEHKLDTAP